MDRIVKSLILIMMALMEVSLLLATYLLGVLYLIYISIRGKRKFIPTFKKLVKDLFNNFKTILKEQRHYMVKA